ncbi:pyruvate dehydrogenase complex component Pdx1 [Aspergillus bombycis]|uniref:Pyruvate dehydrogenase complex component Pdx1 n=1 Tax=Aspergillus bombycis TaxID=109264 RepID=A0A1F7ZWS1_9EURO|nr:pyruvate dehydrogenase complex component Pdx1 [Aspergillus bombycis]OGM43923.1 pyruvate dehydrogenase complex component Pdx1 [Aspergillus bombycis]
MASSFTVRQIPAVLARRQPRVLGTTRRLASSSAVQTQNPAYPLYPSVIQLLHEKGIPESEVSKIPASGPKGRLLKGDVLAYLGSIPAGYPATQQARFDKLAHLDLSNIKIAAPPKPAEPQPVAEESVARPPPTTSVAVSISLATVLSVQKKIQETLGVNVPLATFLARATDLANDDLPRSSREKQSADELFEEVLGAKPIQTSRGDYFPELNAVEAPSAAQPAKPVKEDIIDILSGKVSKAASRPSGVESPAGNAANVFSLTVPVEEEKRARVFLDRVKALLTVEPGRLVL